MKELKLFLTKIRPTLLLTEAPLFSARGLTGDVETHDFDISKTFLSKCQYFLHQALLFTHLCAHLLLSLCNLASQFVSFHNTDNYPSIFFSFLT